MTDRAEKGERIRGEGMNVVHIIGNLTADPQKRTAITQKGAVTVCDFTVAVNRYDKGKETSAFFRVTLWGNMAENAAKYLSKGKKVAVTGAVEASAYTGKDGKPKASLEITQVKNIEYLSGRQPEAESESQQEDAARQEEQSRFVQVDDEDLPF